MNLKEWIESERFINSFDIGLKDRLDKFIFKTQVISEEECSNIIEEVSEREQWKKHSYYDYKEDKNNSIGDDFEIIFPNDLDLVKYVNKGISKYIENYSLDAIIHKITNVRISRYGSGTLMRPHYDHVHSIFPGEEKGVPVLSIVAPLNEDYEGGEFHFFNKDVSLKVGEMLMFPSCFLYPHGVRKILSGTRYSLVCWAY